MRPRQSAATLSRRIEQARGAARADLVVKNAKRLDLVTGALVSGDIAICGDTIVGVDADYSGETEIDAAGRVVVPGFIDAHFHIESSLVTPAEFDRCVLQRGTTTGIWDPHEIANVLGLEGLRYALASAGETAMDLRVALSSCVPATELETSGARLDANDLLPLRDHDRVVGLAEFMNFPGVLAGDPGVLAKLEAFSDGPIDGHAPLLSGTDLNAYAAAGVRTDHETTTADEALEKLRKGMRIFIREGSVSKDLAALAQIISAETSPFLAFCTDDRNPLDIAEEGHIDFLIRDAIRDAAPTGLDIAMIGLGPSGRRLDVAVGETQALGIPNAVQRGDHVGREAPALLQDGVEKVCAQLWQRSVRHHPVQAGGAQGMADIGDGRAIGHE